MRPEHLITRLSSWAHQPTEADRADSFELAVSARRFSRRTQAVVDDKLTFSAALMRAGEVEAANRILAEVGEEVLSEEVALLERVNEVKMSRSIGGRDKVTRGRLARTLAVAMLGSSLLAFSVAGAAFAGLFRDADHGIHGADPGSVDDGIQRIAFDRVMGTRHVKLTKDVSLAMTRSQFRRYTKLTSGAIDARELERFLFELLPASLAQKVHDVLVSGLTTVSALPEEKAVMSASKKLAKSTSVASVTSGTQKKSQSQSSGSDEPKSSEASPEPSDEPSDEKSPSPEESPEDQEGGLPIIGGDDEGGE